MNKEHEAKRKRAEGLQGLLSIIGSRITSSEMVREAIIEIPQRAKTVVADVLELLNEAERAAIAKEEK